MKRWWPLCVLLWACGDEPVTPGSDITEEVDGESGGAAIYPGAQPVAGPSIAFNFKRPELFDAPMPSGDLMASDGSPKIDAWPVEGRSLADALLRLAERTHGASLGGGLIFPFDGEVDAALEAELEGTLRARLYRMDGEELVAVPASHALRRDRGGRLAVVVSPWEGLGWRSESQHIAVVTSSLVTKGLGRSQALADFLAGRAVSAMGRHQARWDEALRDARQKQAFNPAELLAFSVWETTDILADFTPFVRAAQREVRAEELSFDRREVSEYACYYEGELALPAYQRGMLPFALLGEGAFVIQGGAPVLQRREATPVSLYVPRMASPRDGFPYLAYVADPALPEAEAEARFRSLAERLVLDGWAVFRWDPPLGGARGVAEVEGVGWASQPHNPVAMRDGVRQAALEMKVLGKVWPDLQLESAGCEEIGTRVRFDGRKSAIMGEGFGNWPIPLALAKEAEFRLAILVNPAASWSQWAATWVLDEEGTTVAEGLLGGAEAQGEWVEEVLFPWALDGADPQHAAPLAAEGDLHVLVVRDGEDAVGETALAKAGLLAWQVDVGGETVPEDLRESLPYFGGGRVDYPVKKNRDLRTQVAVEVEEPGALTLEKPGVSHQVRCFLKSFAAEGVPTLVAPEPEEACE